MFFLSLVDILLIKNIIYYIRSCFFMGCYLIIFSFPSRAMHTLALLGALVYINFLFSFTSLVIPASYLSRYIYTLLSYRSLSISRFILPFCCIFHMLRFYPPMRVYIIRRPVYKPTPSLICTDAHLPPQSHPRPPFSHPCALSFPPSRYAILYTFCIPSCVRRMFTRTRRGHFYPPTGN